MVYINIFLIAFVVVFIVDVSGAVGSLKAFINRRKGRPEDYDFSLKPLDCSLCMTWWTGLAYILFAGFTLPRLAVVALAAAMVRPMGEMVFLTRDALGRLVAWLSRKKDTE